MPWNLAGARLLPPNPSRIFPILHRERLRDGGLQRSPSINRDTALPARLWREHLDSSPTENLLGAIVMESIPPIRPRTASSLTSGISQAYPVPWIPITAGTANTRGHLNCYRTQRTIRNRLGCGDATIYARRNRIEATQGSMIGRNGMLINRMETTMVPAHVPYRRASSRRPSLHDM